MNRRNGARLVAATVIVVASLPLAGVQARPAPTTHVDEMVPRAAPGTCAIDNSVALRAPGLSAKAATTADPVPRRQTTRVNAAPVVAAIADQSLANNLSRRQVAIVATDADSDPLRYSVRTAGTDAALIASGLGLSRSDPPAGRSGGDVQWFTGSDGAYYFVTAAGALREWNGANGPARGTLIGTIPVFYFLYPDALAAADLDSFAFVLDQRLRLAPAVAPLTNARGLGERWLVGAGGERFYITPAGELFRSNGPSSGSSSTKIATLHPAYHQDVSLLTSARSNMMPATVTGNVVTVGPLSGAAGSFSVEASVSDGTHVSRRRFMVEVDNTVAPTVAPLLTQVLGVGETSVPFSVVAHDGDNDAITVTARAAGSEAYFVARDLSLRPASRKLNWGGTGERWFTGRDGHYFLKPSGELRRWSGVRRRAQGSLVAALPPVFFHFPKLLTAGSDKDLAVVLDSFFDLGPGSTRTNTLGLGERWLAGRNGATFFITPAGDFYANAPVRLLARLGRAHFLRVERLWAAQSDQFGARVNRGRVGVTTKPGYYGRFVVQVTVSDGLRRTTRLVPIEQRHFKTPEAPRVVSALSTGNTTVTVSFSQPMNSTALSVRNYGVVQKNTNPEAGSLIVTGARFVDDQRYDVELTTLSQSEVTYTVGVAGVRDLANRPLAGRTVVAGVVNDPTRSDFAGSPPSGGEVSDGDGDGLTDNAEMRGWRVRISSMSGDVIVRDVTSNPFVADTDGDGLSDAVEASQRLDPRSPDTDDDQLTDNAEFNEIYSNGASQDSDDDGIDDFLEFDFFLTSPNEADTDGDQIDDAAEVLLGTRNARVADLPAPALEVTGTALRLDVRHTVTESNGTSTSTTGSYASTLTRGSDTSRSRSSGMQQEAEVTLLAGYEGEGGGGRGGNGGFLFNATGSWHGTWTWSNSEESSRHTEEVYTESLTTESGADRSTTTQREVVGASIQATVRLRNDSIRAFRMSDVQLAVLMTDPQDPTVLTPVATLLPDLEPENGFSLGPGASRGPVVFTSTTVFPNLVDDLMRNPRGLIFAYSDFDIVDETNRSFEFINEDINDRTAALVINHNGQDADGDGEADTDSFVEQFRVATSAGRTLPDGQRPVLFDDEGESVGITLRQALAAAGLTQNNAATTRAQRLASYATETVTVNGERRERITRVRDTPSPSIPAQPGLGWRIIVDGLAVEVSSLDDVILEAGTGILLAFYLDQDGDGLGASLEYLLGTRDNDRDSDDDCLDDRFEYAIGWKVFVVPGGVRTTYSRPNRADSDFDGLPDAVEAPAGLCDEEGNDALVDFAVAGTSDDQALSCVSAPPLPDPEPRLTTSGCLRFNLPRDLVSDPSRADTDGDGLEDRDEREGYSVDLYSLPTAGNTPRSESVDVWNARTFANQQQIVQTDKVTLTDVFTDPTRVDTDGDTGRDAAEAELGGNPTCDRDLQNFGDPDGDGLVTVLEEDGWHITVIGTSPASGSMTPGTPLPQGTATVVHVTSDPQLADTDGDGIDDGTEYSSTFDPLDQSGTEYTLRTNPRSRDTDGDGLPDRFERDGFRYPAWQNRGETIQVTDPADADFDNDGRSDGDEVERVNREETAWAVRVIGESAYRVFSDPLRADADFDRVPDGSEHSMGSDPYKFDTDGDGRPDDRELALGLDALEDDVRVTVVLDSLSLSVDGDGDINSVQDPGEIGFQLGVRLPDRDEPNGVSRTFSPILTEYAEVTRPLMVRTSDTTSDGVNAAFKAVTGRDWTIRPTGPAPHHGTYGLLFDNSDLQIPQRETMRFGAFLPECSVPRQAPCRSISFSMSADERFAIEGGLLEYDQVEYDNSGQLTFDNATYVSLGGYDGTRAYDLAEWNAAQSPDGDSSATAHRAVFHGSDLLDRSAPGRPVIRDLVFPFGVSDNMPGQHHWLDTGLAGVFNPADALVGTLVLYYVVE